MEFKFRNKFIALAGHDATRALAKMDIKLVSGEYDDHNGLNADDLEEAKEWEQRLACMAFTLSIANSCNLVKYPFVGRLLAPGESANCYENEGPSPSPSN